LQVTASLYWQFDPANPALQASQFSPAQLSAHSQVPVVVLHRPLSLQVDDASQNVQFG